MVPRVIWAGAAFRTVPWVGPFVGIDRIVDSCGARLSCVVVLPYILRCCLSGIVPSDNLEKCLAEDNHFFIATDASSPNLVTAFMV